MQEDLMIPDFLRRTETREQAEARRARKPAEPMIAAPLAWAGKIAKSRLRKLRAEEKRLSEVIDSLGPRDPVTRKKLYAAIKAVEDDIARLTNP